MADVELIINGQAYSGWERIDVQLGMEQLAGSFDLTLIDRWPGLAQPRPVKAGQRCVLRLHGEVLISGYIDEVEAEISAEAHIITVRGRDATGDLVDCAVLQSRSRTGQWRNRTLAQIASDVCAPFGIPVIAQTDSALLRSANVQEGETAYELLDRLAKQAGRLLLTDGKGNLVIAAPATTIIGTELREGRNVLTARATTSWAERFSLYVLKGQRPYTDSDTPSASAHVSARREDPELTAAGRYRPLVILADEHGGNAQQHIDWEAHVRAGRGTRAHITVPGWTHAAGVWRPNTRVKVSCPTLQTDDVLMISSVRFALDNEQGMLTELELADPDAFDVAAGLRASAIGRKVKGKNGLIERSPADKKRRKKAEEAYQ